MRTLGFMCLCLLLIPCAIARRPTTKPPSASLSQKISTKAKTTASNTRDRLYNARDKIRKPLTYKPTDKRRIQADINRRKGQIKGTVKRVPRAERRKAETEQMFERMRNPPPVTPPPSPLSTPTIPQMNRSGQFFSADSPPPIPPRVGEAPPLPGQK